MLSSSSFASRSLSEIARSRSYVPREATFIVARSEEHTSELQSLTNLVCRLLLEKKKSCSGGSAASTSAAPASRGIGCRGRAAHVQTTCKAGTNSHGQLHDVTSTTFTLIYMSAARSVVERRNLAIRCVSPTPVVTPRASGRSRSLCFARAATAPVLARPASDVINPLRQCLLHFFL